MKKKDLLAVIKKLSDNIDIHVFDDKLGVVIEVDRIEQVNNERVILVIREENK